MGYGNPIVIGNSGYGYAPDQPGMFRGALDGVIKGTLAGAFGL